MNLVSPTHPTLLPHPRRDSGHPHDLVPPPVGMAGIFRTHAVASLLWADGRGVSRCQPTVSSMGRF